jgi:ribosomal protein S8
MDSKTVKMASKIMKMTLKPTNSKNDTKSIKMVSKIDTKNIKMYSKTVKLPLKQSRQPPK